MATTELYALSLHDALPILRRGRVPAPDRAASAARARLRDLDEPGGRADRGRVPASRGRISGSALRIARSGDRDRKSTRLNSSHVRISYAVFCLKKKKKITI